MFAYCFCLCVFACLSLCLVGGFVARSKSGVRWPKVWNTRENQGSGVQKCEALFEIRGRVSKSVKHSSNSGVGWPKVRNIRQKQGCGARRPRGKWVRFMQALRKRGAIHAGHVRNLGGWSLQRTSIFHLQASIIHFHLPIEAAVPSNTPLRASGARRRIS